jgi:hypothetical protein
MWTDGQLSPSHLSDIQNLHNFMVKICHNERDNQFEVSAYLHEVIRDIKADIIYVHSLA